jgi:hypothetical protein
MTAHVREYDPIIRRARIPWPILTSGPGPCAIRHLKSQVPNGIVGETPAKGSTVTVSMFEALDALSQEEPHHEHEMHEHDDVCDDACSISAAVISPVGLE